LNLDHRHHIARDCQRAPVVVSVAFGAVLVTYFGWQGFEPAELPG
jgi:hypothetical protein